MKTGQSTIIVVILAGLWALAAKLRVYAERWVPVGYEDENGFHIVKDP